MDFARNPCGNSPTASPNPRSIVVQSLAEVGFHRFGERLPLATPRSLENNRASSSPRECQSFMDTWVWSIVLFLIALAIIALELFVPSGGMLGVLAALAVIGSLVLGYLSSWAFGATMTVVVIVVVPLVIASALKWWPHTPIGRLILNTPPESSDEVLPENDPRYELRELIGTFAIARTKMLPSGIVRIGDRSYDAVAEGQAIEPGQTVKIVGVDLNRLEVRLADVPAIGDIGAREGTETGRGSTPGDDVLARPLDDLGLEPIDIEPRHLLPASGESLKAPQPMEATTASSVTPHTTRQPTSH